VSARQLRQLIKIAELVAECALAAEQARLLARAQAKC
jgi:hypothetical protein